MDWQQHIVTDPAILDGRPVIKETRTSVELIMEFKADGSGDSEILEYYPHLTAEVLEACAAYADAHGIVAYADWDTELCPYHGHNALPAETDLPRRG